jgi:NAD(P)-dependent dehydrogenase (short-subunit alcohol dehydrogenase family)
LTIQQTRSKPIVSNDDLRGTVALVTGGAGGIGRAVVARLARRGATVVVADVDRDGAAQVAAEVGGTTQCFDVSSRSEWHVAVSSIVDAHGRLDRVVLNAGVMSRPRNVAIDEGDPLDWMRDRYDIVRGINLDGVAYGLLATVDELTRHGGAIVATASMSGLDPRPGDPTYSMTKGGVIALVRAIAPSLAERGVRIGAVCPAGTDTPLIPPDVCRSEVALASPDFIAEALERVLDLDADESGGIWVTLGEHDPLRRHEFPDVR